MVDTPSPSDSPYEDFETRLSRIISRLENAAADVNDLAGQLRASFRIMQEQYEEEERRREHDITDESGESGPTGPTGPGS